MAVVVAKRDRHAAIRRLVGQRSIGSQGELVAELSALGFDVTQATVSRDIAELGLAKVMRGDHSVYVNPESLGPGTRPASDERLRRILADIPVSRRPQRPDPGPHRPARHGQRHRPGDRRVDPDRAGRHGRRRQHADRALPRRAVARTLARPVRRPPAIHRTRHWRPLPDEQGRARLLRRPGHLRGGRLAEGAVRGRRRDPHRRRRRRLAARGRRAACDVGRRGQGVRRGRARDLPVAVRVALAAGERAVPGRLPAGDRARPAADRAAPGRGRAARGRGRGRARVHRQGQRPGAVRRRGPRPRPGPGGRRADARGHGPVARPGDRLRAGAGNRDPDHEGVAVLDRRQHLGPLVRDRRARGPVGHPAARRLRVDGRARRRARAGRDRAGLRGRHPGLDRRRAAGLGRAGPAAARPGRRARRRPDRPRRGPPRRHQEPRDLRGARGRDPAHGPPRPRGAGAVQGAAAVQPPGRRRAGADRLRRPVVLGPVARPADLRDVLAAGRVRRRPRPPRPRAGRRDRAAGPR